jgi:sugar lactone lactonase YvrE
VTVEPTTGDVYVADSGNSRIRRIDTSGVITTAAGSGIEGYSTDDVPATTAKLNRPFGVALDSMGRLLIADTGNSRIRRVSASGTITTIAGNGKKGYSGDGGAAKAAKLTTPFSVAAGPMGTVYIADTGNNRVRKVDSSGVITTIAGTGRPGFSGDGGPARDARLYLPSGVAVDETGNVYVADLGNSRVRKISTAGIITTVAGTGRRGFSGDGGAATRAKLYYPTGVAFDEFGALFISDFVNNRVRVVDANGRISTVAGNGAKRFAGDGGSPRQASLDGPFAVAAANNKLYVADAANNRVRLVDGSLHISTLAGSSSDGFSGDGGPAVSGRLFLPSNIATGIHNDLYIADSGDNRVRRVDANGVISTVAGSLIRGFSGDGKPAVTASLAGPKGVAVDRSGNVYVTDTYNNRIRKINRRGIITTIAGTGVAGFTGDGRNARYARLFLPTGIVVDPAGNVYFADTANHRIRRIDRRGIITTIAGTGAVGYAGEGTPARTSRLNIPTGVAIDGSGNVYVADTGNNRVRRIDANGVISTVAGNGRKGYSGDEGDARLASLANPKGIAVTPDGTLYIADTYNQRIRKVTAGRTISTVAGDGIRGLPEQGLPSRLASLLLPASVAVDSAGTLYICDTGDNRILHVEPPVLP